jgi:4-coumarate--CoA ligase
MNSSDRGANPDFSSNELLYQLKETKASVLLVHPDALETALAAARAADIPPDRIVIFDSTYSVHHRENHRTVGELINQGLARSEPSYIERTLKPGEAKTKLAFLSFSSGTTGKPKVRSSVSAPLIFGKHSSPQAVAIPHYSLITNVIQIAAHNNVNKDYCSYEDQRYRPGDIAIGGKTSFLQINNY